jgi:hypothetical protein
MLDLSGYAVPAQQPSAGTLAKPLMKLKRRLIVGSTGNFSSMI